MRAAGAFGEDNFAVGRAIVFFTLFFVVFSEVRWCRVCRIA